MKTGRVSGSCLCRTVQYEINSIDLPAGHCSCYTCRKAHASAYTTTAGVFRENFFILSGEESLSAYESSPGKLRHFCSTCGTHLYAQRPAQKHIILRIATLDEDPGVTPDIHIFTSHRVRWLSCDEVTEYAQWPEKR